MTYRYNGPGAIIRKYEALLATAGPRSIAGTFASKEVCGHDDCGMEGPPDKIEKAKGNHRNVCPGCRRGWKPRSVAVDTGHGSRDIGAAEDALIESAAELALLRELVEPPATGWDAVMWLGYALPVYAASQRRDPVTLDLKRKADRRPDAYNMTPARIADWGCRERPAHGPWTAQRVEQVIQVVAKEIARRARSRGVLERRHAPVVAQRRREIVEIVRSHVPEVSNGE